MMNIPSVVFVYLYSSISINSVTPGYPATDLNKVQVAKTVKRGAEPIVKLAKESQADVTAKFFKDGGEVAW